MACMAHRNVLVVDLTLGEVYDAPLRTPTSQAGLRPEPRKSFTMKSMKDMKKAVAGFRTSTIPMLAEVTVQPFRLAPLPVWPKAKSLHGESSVFCLHEPLNW